MMALNCNRLLKCFGSAGGPFHTRITHQDKKKMFAHVNAVMMREQFINVTVSVNDCVY